MNPTIRSLSLTGAALIALTLPALTGCGPNEARPALPAVEAPESLPAIAPDERAVERDRDLVAREEALVRREADLARNERALRERMREIETRLDRMQQREAELATLEAVAGFEELPDVEEPDVPFERRAESPRVARTIVLTLPASTPIEVEFDDPLSSETSQPGDGFRATVARDVYEDGYLAIPAGSKMLGSVAQADPTRRIGGQARLALSFERVDLPSGEIVPLRSRLDLLGKSQKKKDAATIGGSAAGGAVLGRVLSDKKGKGTAIGAILGAAVGAAVASENRMEPVVVEPGSIAELLLETPIEVAVLARPGDTIASSR